VRREKKLTKQHRQLSCLINAIDSNFAFSCRCDKCGGKGKIVKSTCPDCKGSKVSVGEETFTIIVEKGMAENQPIVFENEADEFPDMTPGDVVFRIKTVPHKIFTRRGDDLHARMRITLLDALVGFSKKISHLDGHAVTVTKNDITKPGLKPFFCLFFFFHSNTKLTHAPPLFVACH
jgi:DnaJ-class molecular chaperone